MVDIEPEWVHLATNEDGIQMNSYFIDHPDMILGEMKLVSGPFGPTPTCAPYSDQSLEELLAEAIQNIHGEITAYDREEELEGEDHSIEADPAVRNFSYTVVNGQIYYRENSRMNPVEVSRTAESRIRGMIELRDCVRALLEYQTEDYPEKEIKDQQAKLNVLYDAFTRKYGLINSRGNAIAFDQDSSYFLLCSLEILDEEKNLKRKADLFTKRTIRSHKPAEKVDTAVEALALSIGEKARVDMEYMSRLTGKDEETLFSDLKGVIFLNPAHTSENDGQEKYLPADEYLSGNVREKLEWAKRSAELYPEDYTVNVQSLEAVQPVDLTASEISVRLGATWLDTEYVRRFIFETLGTPRSAQWGMKVHYSKITGEWRIEDKNKDRGNVKAISTYGTKRINAYEIIEDTLNLKDVRIFDYKEDTEGRRIAVLNKKETAIAQSKQELLKEAFQEWLWKDIDRREAICKTYNSKKDGSVQYSYRCGGYASRVNSCTSHTISADNVEALILSAVKRFSRFVLNDEKAFALELQSLWKDKQEEKPKHNQSELKRCQKRYDELSTLIRGLYENLISGLLPERQYKQLMKQYDDEQAELEAKMETMKKELSEEKDSTMDIQHFISLIRKYKNPTEVSDLMFTELIDKIVVYEAEGVGKAKTQKVDIYFNYVGQVDIAYTEEELAEIKEQEEQEEKKRLEKQRQREKAYREKRKAKKLAENGGEIVKTKVCPHCGKEFTPTSNRQIFCSKDCCYQARQDKTKADREAEKGSHYYRQRVCAVCGSTYWPTHSQQKFCSEECKKVNHNKKTLEFYYKKQKEKELCKDLLQTKEQVSDTNSSEITIIPA